MIEPQYEDYDGSVDIEPFTKFNWKTAESRDQWDPMLSEMAKAKDEAEWRSLLSRETDRKAAIIHVNNYNREKWLKRVGNHGLEYRDIRYSKPYDGFAHKFHPTDINDYKRNTYAVIAEDADIADKMEEAELEYEGFKRHKTVGGLLGFPDCCLDFFNEIWIDKEIKDPMYETACNSDCAEAVDGDNETIRLTDPNPGTNVMWRYFGWSFITHIPCSFDCEHSVEIARQRYNIMHDSGFGAGADAMAQWLNEPHVWTGLHALANIKNAHMTASSRTSDYWSEKKIIWRQENEPQV